MCEEVTTAYVEKHLSSGTEVAHQNHHESVCLTVCVGGVDGCVCVCVCEHSGVVYWFVFAN